MISKKNYLNYDKVKSNLAYNMRDHFFLHCLQIKHMTVKHICHNLFPSVSLDLWIDCLKPDDDLIKREYKGGITFGLA